MGARPVQSTSITNAPCAPHGRTHRCTSCEALRLSAAACGQIALYRYTNACARAEEELSSIRGRLRYRGDGPGTSGWRRLVGMHGAAARGLEVQPLDQGTRTPPTRARRRGQNLGQRGSHHESGSRTRYREGKKQKRGRPRGPDWAQTKMRKTSGAQLPRERWRKRTAVRGRTPTIGYGLKRLFCSLTLSENSGSAPRPHPPAACSRCPSTCRSPAPRPTSPPAA